MTGFARRALALTLGLACHGAFAVAVTAMALGLWSGMTTGRGPFEGPAALAANLLLVAQFPLLHSLFLSRRGASLLIRLGTRRHGGTLVTTSYAILASLQVGTTFLLWSPSDVVWYRPQGAALALHACAFALAGLFLVKALHDGDLRLQTGSLGWTALWRGARPNYRGFPEHGLFARCRQPIYLGFLLVIWTGPVWTPDHLVLALVWSAYCLVGPRLKERRFGARYGAAFDAYRARVPYFVPRLRT